jgi:hypothetical protein
MTRILLAILVLAVCNSTATPQIKVPVPEFQNQKSPLRTPSRMAIVNVAHVLDKYEKAVQLNKDVQVARAPFNKQMQVHWDNVAKWQKAIDEREVTNLQESRS